MENLNDLRQWLSDEGVFVFDRQLPFSNDQTKAATIRLNHSDTWGIFIDLKRHQTSAEEKSTLLHESGHYATGATHEISSPFDLVERHEYKADKWAVTRAITEDELHEAVARGCTELWELADYFGVTEDFMRKAICWYKHGNLAVEQYM